MGTILVGGKHVRYLYWSFASCHHAPNNYLAQTVTEEVSAAVEPHREALVREGYLELQGVNLVAVSLARPSAEKL